MAKSRYTEPIALRITEQQKAKLEVLAEQNESSVSAIIRIAIRQYLGSYQG